MTPTELHAARILVDKFSQLLLTLHNVSLLDEAELSKSDVVLTAVRRALSVLDVEADAPF